MPANNAMLSGISWISDVHNLIGNSLISCFGRYPARHRWIWRKDEEAAAAVVV
jgi:hypothetical protein